MPIKTSSALYRKLEKLELLQDFQENKLTVLRLALVTKQGFEKVRWKLYSAGHQHPIDYSTVITEEWLKVVFKRKSPKYFGFTHKKSTGKHYPNNLGSKRRKKKRSSRNKKIVQVINPYSLVCPWEVKSDNN